MIDYAAVEDSFGRRLAAAADEVRAEAFEARRQYVREERNRVSRADEIAAGWGELDVVSGLACGRDAASSGCGAAAEEDAVSLSGSSLGG